MVSKKLRSFDIDGKEVQFDINRFKELFLKHCAKENQLIQVYEKTIADVLFVDSSAIHNWRMGLNGPGDLEKIHLLEKFWHLKENRLLTEVQNMNDSIVYLPHVRPLTDGERRALTRIDNKLQEILQLFADSEMFQYDISDCMNDVPYDECRPFADDEEDSAFHYYSELSKIMDEEKFFIKKDLYDQLLDISGEIFLMTTENSEIIKKSFGLNSEEWPDALACDCIAEIVDDQFKKIVEPYWAQ